MSGPLQPRLLPAFEDGRRSASDGGYPLANSKKEAVPNKLPRTRYRAHAPRELRELLHNLLVEIRHDALDAAELVLLQRKNEARLKPLEHAAVEILWRLARQDHAGTDMSTHPREFEMNLCTYNTF